MPILQPAAINSAFAAAYNARDVDTLIGLYEADAIVVNMDGSRSVGVEAIHHHLAELVQLGGSMTSTNLYAIEHGDVALVGAHWSVSFDDGREPVSGRSAEVVRRQSDSTWKYIIDNPDSPTT
jgi:ketosteroid isomerase-like protein